MPGNYRSLIDHIGSGKDWMLDRKKGGLFLVPGNPYGTSRRGMRFLLRDIISNKVLFQRSDKPYVVMCGSNVVFNIDLNQIIDAMHPVVPESPWFTARLSAHTRT